MKWNCYVVLLFRRKKKEFAIESHTKRNNSVYILLDRNQSPFVDGHQVSCQIQFFLLVRVRIRITPNHKLSKSLKLKRTNYPETQASESLPILAPESELVSPAGPLLDRLEALQRRHRVPKQQPATTISRWAQPSLPFPGTETKHKRKHRSASRNSTEFPAKKGLGQGWKGHLREEFRQEFRRHPETSVGFAGGGGGRRRSLSEGRIISSSCLLGALPSWPVWWLMTCLLAKLEAMRQRAGRWLAQRLRHRQDLWWSWGGQITVLTLQLHLMANEGCGHQLGVGRMMSCGSSEVFVYILREKWIGCPQSKNLKKNRINNFGIIWCHLVWCDIKPAKN